MNTDCVHLPVGREKLGCVALEAVRVVLEADGTHIDDGEYLKWLPDNTVFLLLRPGELWTPSHRQQQRASATSAPVSAAIPRVVCEALNLLEIRTEPPFWKIIDNRGRITLVLHWELPPNNRIRYVEPNRCCTGGEDMTPAPAPDPRSSSELRIKSVAVPANEDVVTVVSEDGATVTTLKNGRMETLINNVHHAPAKDRSKSGQAESSGSLPYRVAATIHLPAPKHPHSGHQHNADECEFHCGSLHEEGRSIQGAEGRRKRSPSSSSGKSNAHVRFHETLDVHKREPHGVKSATRSKSGVGGVGGGDGASGGASSESEAEPESSNTVEEEFENEGNVTTEKLLLLTDQLSADQRKHLTILDLGVILERLRAKIIDVERLEREREGPNCFRWFIKATIRGEVLRDLGVLYNGNYYSISEHPGLAYAASGFEDDEEDREDPV